MRNCLIFVAVQWFAVFPAIAAEISYSRDIRPILAEHCFRCHGPDEKQRKADLRLDVESEAKRVTEGRGAVVPNALDKSDMWARINSQADDERMPPPETAQKLTPNQIEIIRRWIEEGAKWEQHWAFVPPSRPKLPPNRNSTWAVNPIDRFIASMHDALKLEPSPVADKETLIRRITFDLTGLPPTLDEIDAYLADDSPNAYEKLVDRLLASPGYGERMAWGWLEAARYADTSGYQNDGPRSMWRWRDWVIDALNAGKPFNQFAMEQIAGDLFPNATLDQKIATGFNRNHRGNSEGGIIPEEYQVEYVVDRVDTTSTVWLALTMGCARCHDHKYDPISQRDFYRVFALFNNIPEYGRAIKEGNSPPYVVAPTQQQQVRLAELESQLAGAERHWSSLEDSVTLAQREWESANAGQLTLTTSLSYGPLSHLSLDSEDVAWKTVNGPPAWVDGKIGKAIQLNGQQHVDAGDIGNFGYLDKFSVAMWVKPEASQGTIIARMVDEEQADGWYVLLRDGHVQVNLVKRWLDDSLRVESEQQFSPGVWTHLTMTYDGSRQARGVVVYANGQPLALKTQLDLLNQTFTVKEPLRIGAGGGPASRFAGTIDDVQIFNRILTPDEALQLSTADSIPQILAIEAVKRTSGQQRKIREYFLRHAAGSHVRGAYEHLLAKRNEVQKLRESLPTVMVMQEMPSPRKTHVLIRGEYNRPGELVTAGVPSSLCGESIQPNDRLAFAQWLVSKVNPLTARVAVNRLWQLHFGTGLVRTTEDFGMQGEAPSHPDLLDWLAVEFSDGDEFKAWDMKRIQRQIVTSATYRQSSSYAEGPNSSKDHVENRWLARAPRQRLSAEMLRDQALAASGLLVQQVGGPSVKTYQPADLWKDLATDSIYEQDHGEKLYRRSLYTYWKRTVAPPSMTTFDASGREACQVKSVRTNTPLQALTLLNEITFVEAARVMAQRVMAESAGNDSERLAFAFRLTTSRRPSPSELAVLERNLKNSREHFRADPQRVNALLKVGERSLPEGADSVDLAAFTVTCNLLLNLDEAVTRQ